MLDGVAHRLSDQAAPTLTEHRDVLTRIRGIDDVLARRLAALGIQRFAQIAQWTHDDLRTIVQALGLGRDVLRHGVIEQAATLESERQARAQLPSQGDGTVAALVETTRETRAVARPGPTLLGMSWEHGATWHAHVAPSTLQGLNGQDPEPVSAAVLARLHQGLPINHLMALNEFAPEIAVPIFIPSDACELFVAPRWLPAPMLQIAAAETFMTAQPAPTVATPTHDASGAPPEPTAMETIEQPAAPAAVPAPLHEQAQQRLDEFEVLLEGMTSPRPSAVAAAAATDQNIAPRVMRVLARAPAAEAMPRDVLRKPFTSPLRRIKTSEQEANVEIVRRPIGQRGSMLAPLPGSPLTPRQQVTGKPSDEADTPTNIDGVQEAAVIIVHRDTGAAVAGAVATSTSQNRGSVRRFLTALGAR